MYLFSLLAMPMAFLSLAAWSFGISDRSGRAYFLGLLLGIPSALLWLLARPLFAPSWGSPLLALDFFLGYWLLPFGLSSLALSLSIGLEALRGGRDYDKAFAFLMGSLSLFSAVHAVSSWGHPSRAFALALPCLLVSSAAAYPVLLEEAVKDGLPGGLKYLALVVLAFAVASLGLALFFMRLEWLGIIMTAAYAAGAALVGFSRLRKTALWDQRGSNPPPTA